MSGRHVLPQLQLAAALTRLGDPRAVALLEDATGRGGPSAPIEAAVQLALVAALHASGRAQDAADRMGAFLEAYAAEPLDAVVPLAGAVARGRGLAGWIGRTDGRLLLGATAPGLRPTDVALRCGHRCLVPEWRPVGDGLWEAPCPSPHRGGPPVVSGPTLLGSPLHLSDAARDVAPSKPTKSGTLPGTAPAPVASRRERDAGRLRRLLRDRSTLLLVTHDEGGGVERHVQERAEAFASDGVAALLLRSRRDGAAVQLEVPSRPIGALRFAVPDEAPALQRLLRGLRLQGIEFHHLRRHGAAVRRLPASLGLPYDVVLHDYAPLCPRVTLVGPTGRYCGEPALPACEACAVAYEDTPAVAPEGVAALRRDALRCLAGARRVVAPSADIAGRFARYLPGLRVDVQPWEPLPGLGRRRSQLPAHGGPATVCVVGAIGPAKGFDVLLACARDAQARSLPLRFTVVGHTSDDAALLRAGAWVTGSFREEERAELIARQGAACGFLPSVWPEPWCYALTGLLLAGLPTLCFDLGAQAERVRAAGGCVAPLGTAAADLNDHLLHLAGLTPRTWRHQARSGEAGSRIRTRSKVRSNPRTEVRPMDTGMDQLSACCAGVRADG